MRQFNREKNFISRTGEENPSAFPTTMKFEPENYLCDILPAALLSLNHTNDRYPMSNQYPQASTHQPRTDSDPVFSSLRIMESKRKRFFCILSNKITYRTYQ